jgi:hypothetical protein
MTDPLTKQRSSWQQAVMPEMIARAFAQAKLHPTYHERNVHDGLLIAIVCEEAQGWHLSISHEYHHKRGGRYPTWDEIAHARTELLPEGVDMVMRLPAEENAAVNGTTFHIHEHPEREAS